MLTMLTMPTTQQHILIVEDEPPLAEALRLLLGQASYATTHCRTGEDALAQLSAHAFDLVLLDVMLPDMEGYRICHHVRKLPGHTPVIILTARDRTSDKIMGLELGADLYLTKPFEPEELIAHIRALFRLIARNNPLTLQSVFMCGPICLNHDERCVEVNGKQVDLSPKEYDLLREFLQQPDRALGRETLLRSVWGYDAAVDSRTVDTHVSQIRSKLGLTPANGWKLTSVYQHGYRLEFVGTAGTAMRESGDPAADDASG